MCRANCATHPTVDREAKELQSVVDRIGVGGVLRKLAMGASLRSGTMIRAGNEEHAAQQGKIAVALDAAARTVSECIGMIHDACPVN